MSKIKTKIIGISWLLIFGICFLPLGVMGQKVSLQTRLNVPQQSSAIALNSWLKNKEALESSNPEITLTLTTTSLAKALKVIAKEAAVSIYYNSKLLPDKQITLQAKDMPLGKVLQRVLKGTFLKAVTSGRSITLHKMEPRQVNFSAKNVLSGLSIKETVSGTVTDAATGQPLIGVSILVVGTSTGTTTDVNGHYSLNVLSLQDSLRFTYIGYKTKSVAIDGRTTINVSLESSITGLNEVVVIGLGQTQTKGTLTSAVSTVSAKQIQDISVQSTNLLLQGQSAGVRVVSGAGGPGAAVKVRIRGTSSISGGQGPLYVVDGVPILTGNFSQGSGFPTSALAYLNPNDIKSITVLKDASATAIYGARAANGVVLIQTKQGAFNKPMHVEFSTYVGTTKAVKKPQMVTGSQFEMLMNEAAKNNGKPILYAHPEEAINTNWIGLVFRPGFVQSYNLSLNGGSEGVKYSLSGSHFKQKGILLSKGFKRSTARLNLGLDASKDLTLNTSLAYSFTHRNRSDVNSSLSGILSSAVNFPTNVPVYQPDGSYTVFSIFDNPIADAKERIFGMDVTRFVGNISAKYDFFSGLTASTKWSYDRQVIKGDRYYTTRSTTGNQVDGEAVSSAYIALSRTGRLTLDYVKDAGNNHFNFLIGGSLEIQTYNYTSAQGTHFPSDKFRHVASAAVLDAYSSARTTGLLSIFGRLQYDYNQRYLITLNIRRDGSSRFGENNRWGTFPSAGLGWVISKEPFFNADFVNDLKFRVSYGLTGNQSGIGSYQPLGLWEGSSYGDLPGIAPDRLANPNLKWETTSQFDIGFDMDLFKSRLSITYDYYHKSTRDLLLNVPIPFASGFNSVVKNIGKLSNKGMELSISGRVVQKNNLSWDLRFNIAGNRNLVEKLAAPFTATRRNLILYKEGEPMYSFYLNKQLGVNPDNGDIIYADVNGDGKFEPSGDRTILGSPIPDFYGGMSNSLDYKQIGFKFFFQYSYGGKMLYMNRYFLEHGGTRAIGFLKSQLKRWQEPGDHTMVPKLTSANYKAGVFPSRLLSDASFIRLKNVTLSYSLSSKLAKKMGIVGARIYVSGQNLFTITNYIGLSPGLTFNTDNQLVRGIEFSTMPPAKMFKIGLNITF